MENHQTTQITEEIINCFYNVYNELGYGFLEKVYEKALKIELKERGFDVESQYALSVFYKGHRIGEYYCDLVVNRFVIIELKAATCIQSDHEAQLLNYLRATDMEVGLILNFGPKPNVRRKVFSNHGKVQRLTQRPGLM